jgi:hypothetical protein
MTNVSTTHVYRLRRQRARYQHELHANQHLVRVASNAPELAERRRFRRVALRGVLAQAQGAPVRLDTHRRSRGCHQTGDGAAGRAREAFFASARAGALGLS